MAFSYALGGTPKSRGTRERPARVFTSLALPAADRIFM